MINLNSILNTNPNVLDNKVIAFPTDTVYGLGCKWNDLEAIEKIYEIKKRDCRKPIAVLVSNIDQILPFIDITYSNTINLLKKYWPGAVTFIFKKKEDFSYLTETIAFRMPDSNIARSLIDHFGPLATTSVNLSGEKEINDPTEIEKMFNNQVDYIISDLETFSSVSSTIVDLSSDKLRIIRQGTVIINE